MKHIRMQLWIPLVGVVLIATAALFLVNYNSDSSKQATENWPKLRIGYLPIAAELPLFVAVEQGFFTEVGIEFELIQMVSSNDLGNAATADRIDILSGAASNVIYDIGHVSGKKHLMFAINPYSNTQDHVTDYLIARTGSEINALEDIRGRKVASFPGSVNRIFTYLILEKYGIPRDSYDYIEMSPKDWQPSLQSGAVDVVSALEPNATQIIHDGVGYSIFSGFYADLMPDVPLSAHWVAADFYKRASKSQLIAFLNAYERAIDFSRNHEDSAKTYLTTYASVRPDILESVNLNPWKKLSEIDVNDVQSYVNLLADNEALQARVEAQSYILPDPR